METSTVMLIILGWIIASVVVGTIGSDRKIGFGAVFGLSLLASPIIGALVALGSERKSKLDELNQKGRDILKQAIEHAGRMQYEAAIKLLHDLLALQPGYPSAYYNLACCYSKLSKKDEAFSAMAAAVKSGYSNFQRIQSDPDLAFLRSQPEFPAFASGGYHDIIRSTSPDDTISKLERLAALKGNGSLTEQEFLEQKAKILKGN